MLAAGALSAAIMNSAPMSFMRFIELAPDNPTSSAQSKLKSWLGYVIPILSANGVVVQGATYWTIPSEPGKLAP